MKEGSIEDPVALCIREALARRAADLPGPAQQWLLQRAARWQAPGSAETPVTPGAPEHPLAAEATRRRAALASLSAQIDRLGRLAAPLPAHTTSPAVAPPLRAVAAFKGTWSRLRAEQRLRQALAQVPLQAGPLNSSNVVHRALQTLHALAPEYLDALMAHLDTLLALEQASGGGASAARPGQRIEEAERRPAPAKAAKVAKAVPKARRGRP